MANLTPYPDHPGITKEMAQEIIRQREASDFGTKDWGIFDKQPSDVSRVTPEGLNVRSVQTVAVDPFTGELIQASPQGNMPATRQALTRQQADGFRESFGAGPRVANSPNQPSGSVVVGKDGSRLGDNEYRFAYGDEPVNPALNAIDTAATTVPLPRPRPDRGFVGDPGNGGMFGIPMSPGMAQIIANDPKYAAQRTGVAPVRVANPQVAQALAAQQRAPVPVPAAPFYSNGVPNPAYRDYGPQTSSDGGTLPANAFGGNGGGGFTDSLGGRYYDRHL